MSGRDSVALGVCAAAAFSLPLIAGSEPQQTPPPAMWIGELPVRGSLDDALRAGFTRCVEVGRKLRCRREGVMLVGAGPYTAAADLRHTDGSGGFTELLMWHQWDQGAVSAVGKTLLANGWTICRTGPNEFRGDQAIYTRPGARVRISIDLSYWGKRRLRVIPERGQPTGHCW